MNNCPVCECRDHVVLDFTSDQSARSFQIAECSLCSHRFVLDPPSHEQLHTLYNHLYADDQRRHGAGKPQFRDRALVRRLVRQLPSDARVLDIGANFGATLLAFPTEYRLEGVELSETPAATAAQNPRLTIHTSAIESLELQHHAYDCITALALIEHILDTRAFLDRVASLLRPNGIVVLMTGDYRSWCATEAGRDWSLYHSDGHLHFFSGLSLELALNRSGLAVYDRLWAGPNRVSSRMPSKIARAMHCQATSLTAPWLFARKQQGDHIYLWARPGSPLKRPAAGNREPRQQFVAAGR